MDSYIQEKINSATQILQIQAQFGFSEREDEIMSLAEHFGNPMFLLKMAEGEAFAEGHSDPKELINVQMGLQKEVRKALNQWLKTKDHLASFSMEDVESDDTIQEYWMRLEEKLINRRSELKDKLAYVTGLGIGLVNNREALEQLHETMKHELSTGHTMIQ